MADEEVVCQKPALEEACKPTCIKQFAAYQQCAERIEKDESGLAHCTGQYFDYWQCVDKCVAPQLFKKLKYLAHLPRSCQLPRCNMEQSKPMGMIRLDREEEVYDREKVLGRDIKTVFPTEIRKAEKESNVETFRAIFGDDKRFVTESELSGIQKRRHGDAETSEPSKPLADVLRENKEAKEAAFQASWKDMKTGKNRPLTAEELEFFDELADTSAREKRRERLREEEELELFRLEHQATAEARGSLPDDPGTSEAAPLSAAPLSAAPLSAAPLSAAPLSAASLLAATRSAAPEPQMAAKGSAGVMIALPAMGKVRARLVARSAEPGSKRARPAEENKADPAEDPAEVEGDLAGLLGAYATSSEDEA